MHPATAYLLPGALGLPWLMSAEAAQEVLEDDIGRKQSLLTNSADEPIPDRKIVEATIAFANGEIFDFIQDRQRPEFRWWWGAHDHVDEADLTALRQFEVLSFLREQHREGSLFDGPQGMPEDQDLRLLATLIAIEVGFREEVRAALNEIVTARDGRRLSAVVPSAVGLSGKARHRYDQNYRNLIEGVAYKPAVLDALNGPSITKVVSFDDFGALVRYGTLLLLDEKQGFGKDLRICRSCEKIFLKYGKNGRDFERFCTSQCGKKSHNSARSRAARRKPHSPNVAPSEPLMRKLVECECGAPCCSGRHYEWTLASPEAPTSGT